MDGPKGLDSMKTYALSGKIMLSAIVILFAVVIFMVCLHLYARWYLIRARRRHLRRRSRRRSHLVFYLEPNNPNAAPAIASASRGLDAAVLRSLPVFVYSKAHPEGRECAVCLSEFEENEKGRVLPKCNHYFHTDCIDMWFHSHSTCPLCRSPVEPLPSSHPVVVVSAGETAETEAGGSSSGLAAACQDDEPVPTGSTSSLCDRRKAFETAGLTIELPMRPEPEHELGPSSPASHSFKSPASRLLSWRRILSMNRKAVAVSPSSGVGTSCGPATGELDIECGRDESTQTQNLVQTPR